METNPNANTGQRFEPYNRRGGHHHNRNSNGNSNYRNGNNKHNNNNNNNNNNNYRNNRSSQHDSFNQSHFNLKYKIVDQDLAEVYIHPYSKFDQPFPKFEPPVEVGIIASEKRLADIASKTNDENRQGFEKSQGIKYLVVPKDSQDFNFDLKLGLDKFVPHLPHQNGIDVILKWLLENKSKLMMKHEPNSTTSISKLLETDFVSWRGLITTIAFMPYEKNKDMMFTIIPHRGTFYFCEIETEDQRNERLNMDDRGKLMTYMGHKFESYLTSDLPNEAPPGADDVPDQENNFAAVVSARLSEHALLYPAEVDCCMLEEHKALSDFCELKTSVGNSIQDLNLNRNIKFLKWWLQSYLIGIEKIKVGMRTEDGFAKKLIDLNISDIIGPNNKKWWKENICFNYLKDFLEVVKKFCTEENHMYMAKREKGSELIKISKMSKDSDDYTEKYFLREWYTSAL